MTLSRRSTFILLVVGFLFLTGILFRDFLVENFIQPVALVLWLFWRFLQVFDQHICWGVLVFGVLFFAFYRLLARPFKSAEKPPPSPNATLELMNYWRTMILITSDETDDPNILKRSLAKILASIYASKLGGTSYFEVISALKDGDIPLPASIHAFLFPDDRRGSHRSFAQLLNAIRQYPHEWLRRRTGRDIAEYHQSIAEVLDYMDTLMEDKHDDH